ncbi:MAG: glycosyltransferase family 39 protein [Candidatus Kerfeldbacteria bacterium]
MRRVYLIVIVAIAVGMGLRIAAGGTRLLWNDEAETTINSLQILDHGYPSSTYKGKALYENAVYIPSDDPKYAYESTNYYGTKFERNKGWLTYYYQAPFLKLFGFSTTSARLPFVLLSGVTILLIFVLGRKLFTPMAGAIAASLYAINYFSIWYEMQARYYSLLATLAVLFLYSSYRSVTDGKWRSYLLALLSLVLLFYTHLVAFIAAALFFVCAHTFKARTIRSVVSTKIAVTVVGIAITVIPWILVVRLWEVPKSFSDYSLVMYWSIILVLIGAGIVAVLRYTRNLIEYSFSRFTAVNYLLLYCVVVTVLKPFLTPDESFGARTFIELNPIFCILGGTLVTQFMDRQWRQRASALLFPCIFLVCTFAFFNVGMTRTAPVSVDAGWVRSSIAALDRMSVSATTPVFVSFQQFPFMLYSDYNIDLVWPIRTSYLDSYPNRLIMILDHRMLWPRIFYRRELLPMREYNFAQRLKRCTAQQVIPEVVLYDCPALRPAN